MTIFFNSNLLFYLIRYSWYEKKIFWNIIYLIDMLENETVSNISKQLRTLHKRKWFSVWFFFLFFFHFLYCIYVIDITEKMFTKRYRRPPATYRYSMSDIRITGNTWHYIRFWLCWFDSCYFCSFFFLLLFSFPVGNAKNWFCCSPPPPPLLFSDTCIRRPIKV